MKKLRILQALQVSRLNRQIAIIMITTITIPLLVISAIIYLSLVSAVREEYENSSHLILTNLSFNIDQYLQSIETGTLTAIMNNDLQRALENWSANNNTNLTNANVIEQFVSTIEMTIKNVDSVQIYTNERVFYSANFNRSDYQVDQLTEKEWYQRTLDAKGNIVIFGTHKPFHRVDATNSVISIARVINKIGTKKALSVMLVDMRLDSLKEILAMSETTNRKFVILDKNHELIYSTHDEISSDDIHSIITKLSDNTKQANGSFYATINNERSFINFVTSEYSEWQVFQYIDANEMVSHARKAQNIVMTLALCSLGTTIFFMFILFSRVTKPIIQLSKQVKLVGAGNFQMNLRNNRRDEFGVLYQGILKMVEDLKLYIERLSDAKAQQKMTQYGALKSQINPHFLANSLETIQMKAIINKDKEVSEMVGLLGKLFRSFIPNGKETLSLKEELEQIRLYMKVQQLRFGDKIQYIEDLAPGSEQCLILHFTLQPIIENAIVHGIERKVDAGQLILSTQIIGNELNILISDNGVGMTEEQLNLQRKRLQEDYELDEDEHIGVKNVHDRIRYYYGDRYGIELYSEQGLGTTVKLILPIKNDFQ